MRNESSYSNCGASATGVARALAPRRVRLWVICDEGAALTELKSLLLDEDVVMTKWADLLTTRRTMHEVEVIVVDVAAAHLANLLRMLREDLGCEQCAILVNVRAPDEPPSCGVLPRYRAMACVWEDLTRLTQNHSRGAKAMPLTTSALL